MLWFLQVIAPGQFLYELPEITAPKISLKRSPTIAPTIAPTIVPTIAPTIAPNITPKIAPKIALKIAPKITPTIAPKLLEINKVHIIQVLKSYHFLA